MLNKAFQEITTRILRKNPQYGHITFTLLFDEFEFFDYEFEYAEGTIVKDEDIKNVD